MEEMKQSKKSVAKKAPKKVEVNKEEEEVEQPEDIEKAITKAMRSRVGHFREQADSLTLEGVRRVLEKDLGLETFALDAHKKFVKQCLQEFFDGASEESASKNSGETVDEVVNPPKEEIPDLSEELHLHKKEKKPTSEDEEKLQGSPVEGLLGDEATPNDNEDAQSVKVEKALNDDTLREAIRKRASYLRVHSESLTMVSLRRLLEEDLELDTNTLDPYKNTIRVLLDEVLQISGDADPADRAKNKRVKKGSLSKASRKASSEGSSESSESEDEEVAEEEVTPKKKVTTKGKTQNSSGLKNLKRPAKETTSSSTKRKRSAESTSEESSDEKDGGNLSEDGHSQSSNEEPVKKKRETSTQMYGKHVEHLKSVIKSCGMSVPPTIYKRVKQAPESKREAALVKELEEILKREGLSTNPSEKEIKAVKKQKERTKELEGIDLSNIVSSSRRRSTSSFVPPPKPKIPDESDDDDDDDDSEDEEDTGAESNSEGASQELEDAEDESD